VRERRTAEIEHDADVCPLLEERKARREDGEAAEQLLDLLTERADAIDPEHEAIWPTRSAWLFSSCFKRWAPPSG
jgi:hypothetical protein